MRSSHICVHFLAVSAIFPCNDLVYTTCDSVERLIAGHEIRQLEVLPDFCTPGEEKELMVEVERTLRRKRYEYDHWDDVSLLSGRGPTYNYLFIPKGVSEALPIAIRRRKADH